MVRWLISEHVIQLVYDCDNKVRCWLILFVNLHVFIIRWCFVLYWTLRLRALPLNCKTFCRRHHHLPPHHQPARLKCPPVGSGCPTTVGVRQPHAFPPTKMPNHAHHQHTQHHPIDLHHTVIHRHNLQTTDTAKYLGIHIHNTLNWNTHINKTA